MALTTDVRADIRAANDLFVARFLGRDAAGIAALYTDGAWLLPPNSAIVKGTEGIRAFWQGALDMGLTSAKLETIDLESFGDTTIEVGHYTLQAGQNVADEGKYIVEWKLRPTGWLLHRDIWNSNRPPAK